MSGSSVFFAVQSGKYVRRKPVRIKVELTFIVNLYTSMFITEDTDNQNDDHNEGETEGSCVHFVSLNTSTPLTITAPGLTNVNSILNVNKQDIIIL